MRMTLRLVSVALLLSTSSALAFDTSKLIQFGSLPLDDFTPIITKSRVASSLVGYRLRLLGLRDAAPHPSRYSGPRDLAFNPLVGLRGRDLLNGVPTLLKAFINESTIAARQWLWFMGELGKIAV